MQVIQVVANGQVTLACPVNGYPKPQITWIRGHKTLTNNASLLTFMFQLLKFDLRSDMKLIKNTWFIDTLDSFFISKISKR